jgi:hypothetical protein
VFALCRQEGHAQHQTLPKPEAGPNGQEIKWLSGFERAGQGSSKSTSTSKDYRFPFAHVNFSAFICGRSGLKPGQKEGALHRFDRDMIFFKSNRIVDDA